MSLIRPTKQQTLDFASISNKAIWIYSWLDWIISGELEFSFVDKPTTQSYTNLQTMTRPTLMEYMDLATKGVQKLISKDITDSFGVIFDNWTHNTTHYFAVYQ